MSKVHVSVTYGVDLDIGELPLYAVEDALKQDSDFNIWELTGKVVVESVSAAAISTSKKS